MFRMEMKLEEGIGMNLCERDQQSNTYLEFSKWRKITWEYRKAICYRLRISKKVVKDFTFSEL